MRRGLWKRACALTVALCVICGGFGLAEAVDADRATIQQVQEALNAAGFDCGTADGISGKKTRAAIEAYQEANGLTANGSITDELLESMDIELPAEGSAEPKDVKGESPLRTVRIPIGGPAYVSDFDNGALMRANYLHWNTRVRTVGTVDDLSGRYPVSQQKEEQVILVRGADGNLSLADYSKLDAELPDFQRGNRLTVSGRVGDTRIGVVEHIDGAPDRFLWDKADSGLEEYYEGAASWVDREVTGDVALCIQADAIELGETEAPNVQFDSIAYAADLQLATVLDGGYSGWDADGKNGWLVLEDGESGEDGEPSSPLVNYYTGAVIPWHRYAEAYLCDDGILQFEWRDAQTGEVVDPEDAVLRYANRFEETGEAYDAEKYGEPRRFQLFAKYYDFEGELKEERPLGEYRQDEKLQDYARLEEATGEVRKEFKAHESALDSENGGLSENQELLKFVNVDGDAVAYDADGNELIRYPFTDPDELYGVLLKDEGVITVMYRGSNGVRTEIFLPRGEESGEAPEEGAAVITEQNVPESAYKVMEENGGEFPGIRIVGTVDGIFSADPWGMDDFNYFEMIPLISTNGRSYYVEYGGTGVAVPGYGVGDTLTVFGREDGDNTYSYSYNDGPTIDSCTRPVIVPSFIALGDVPVPEN